MTTASSSGLASGPVPVRRAARSELVRWRRSSVAFAPLLGFAVATLQALFFVAVGIAQGWASVLAWNVIWVTGLALPATGLIVGLVAERDRGARDGGATWRNVTPLTSSVARLAIVSGAVVLMNVLAVIPVLAVGSVVANGPAPVGRTVLTALAISLGCVAIIPILDLVARRRGLFMTLGLAVVWSVAGVLTAESQMWWALPFAWPMRVVLPLVGTHANGVPFTPGAAIAQESPLPAFGLSLALLVVSFGIFALVRIYTRPVSRSPRARSSEPLVPTPAIRLSIAASQSTILLTHSRPSTVLPHLLTLRRTSLPWLAGTALTLEAFTVVLWHSAAYSAVVFELLILPVGASLLPILAWSKASTGWRGMATRPTSATRLGLGLSASLCIGIAAVSVVSALIELAVGASISHVASLWVLAVTVGSALMSFHLWLTVRFSTGLAIGIMCLGVLFSLVVGGSSLASTLWAFGPWAWVFTASDYPLRALAITTVSLTATALLQPLIVHAEKRYATLS